MRKIIYIKAINHKTFTLIELILVVAIVAVLAGTMIPYIKGAVEDTKVAKILNLYETVKIACQQHHSDTTTYAREYQSSPNFLHTLTYDNGFSGWDGPYINKPLEADSNPYTTYIAIGNIIALGNFPYDVDGDGVDDRSGLGNALYVYGVPATAAKKINDVLDNHLDDTNWQSRGKVEYYLGPVPAWNCLSLYISGGI